MKIQNQPTDEHQMMNQQHNPYAEFEPAFDIVPLPSKGMFYPLVDGKPVDEVKVYYLTAEDEGIMTSPNIIQSGNMIDLLLKKKVVSAIPVEKLTSGDRTAILLYLRVTMERIYKITAIDPDTNLPFPTEVDLTTLQHTDVTDLPNDKGLFDFMLPISKRRVTFRLMTGEDEQVLRSLQKQEESIRKSDESNYSILKLEQSIVSIEGIPDRLTMSHFIKNMPLMDSRKLLKYMKDVMPTISLETEVIAPSGKRFRNSFSFTAEFFYPTN